MPAVIEALADKSRGFDKQASSRALGVRAAARGEMQNKATEDAEHAKACLEVPGLGLEIRTNALASRSSGQGL